MAGLCVDDAEVVYHLRDINKELVEAWKESFADYPENFVVSCGDIFEDAPSADAIVSPANSFGFMDGGIGYAYTKHFGTQMQKRLQDVIKSDYDGELLVGQAAIISAYGSMEMWKKKEMPHYINYNQGIPIKYLISAPTMRVPINVKDTPNSYLAFRAVILTVRKHNSVVGNEPIRSVLVPGLGTAVGRMPKKRCAYQMLQAYETYVKGKTFRIEPKSLTDMYKDNQRLIES